MPSFFRPRSSSPNYAWLLPEAVPTKVVGFMPGPTPVTAVSRPLNNPELWILYDFEMHAQTCPSCRDPYSVHRAQCRLCSTGHQLAQRVAGLVWSRGNGRDTYDATAPAGSRIRVEIPGNYEEVRSLLRAMERSLRHRHQAPIVSFDRTYVISEPTPKTVTRTPERRKPTKESSPSRKEFNVQTSPSRTKSVRIVEPAEEPERRTPEIVDWPEAEYEIREPSRIIQPSQTARPSTPVPKQRLGRTTSPSKRASILATQPITYSHVPSPEVAIKSKSKPRSSEEKDPRRQSMFIQSNAYNTEVREPKGRSRRYSTVLF